MKLAVIGCGYWGPNLVRNFVQSNKVRELICCDLDQKRLNRMKTLYPSVEVISDYKELLRAPDLDAAVIATSVKFHHPIAKDFLLHGKHVFIEKPLTHSYETALELVKLAEEKNKVLMVGHTFEYTAAVNKIREIVESGELGKLFYISCIRVNLGLIQPDINVVWDLAPHDISTIIYIIGETPISVNSQGQAHFKPAIEDVATTTLNFKNGLIAFIHNSWLDPNKIRRTTIVGSRRMLVYDDIEPQEKIKIYDKGVAVPPYYDTFAEFQFSYRYGDIHSPRIEDYEPLKKECDHFLTCIQKGISPLSDGYSGLRVVSILEAANKSIKLSGKSVPIQGLKLLNKKSKNNGNGFLMVNGWR
ncbi:MAG: oxidoreductase [Deltaproteobacteria bacterium RBG_19FT_COMBO_46_12]|nr:MAG: oxidoreductase [Deltaproteobacteria bacterium RBG_19FT_COMBO_46_12]